MRLAAWRGKQRRWRQDEALGGGGFVFLFRCVRELVHYFLPCCSLSQATMVGISCDILLSETRWVSLQTLFTRQWQSGLWVVSFFFFGFLTRCSNTRRRECFSPVDKRVRRMGVGHSEEVVSWLWLILRLRPEFAARSLSVRGSHIGLIFAIGRRTHARRREEQKEKRKRKRAAVSCGGRGEEVGGWLCWC